MSPEETVQQFQQIVGALQRMVAAASDLAERVEKLESNSGETLGALTSIQGSLQVLLQTYEAHTQAQNKVNTELAATVVRLEARLEDIENRLRGPVM